MAKDVTIRFIRNVPDMDKKPGDTLTMPAAEYKAHVDKGRHPKTGKPLSPYVNHAEVISGNGGQPEVEMSDAEVTGSLIEKPVVAEEEKVEAILEKRKPGPKPKKKE